MEFIIEFLFELIFEGACEITQNRRVSKWIRYPLSILIIGLILTLIIMLAILGLSALKENLFFGLLLIAFDIFLIVGFYLKVRKQMLDRKNNE